LELIGGELSSGDGVVAYTWRRDHVDTEGIAMPSTAKADQAARVKARERRLAMERDRAARDSRIEDAATTVFAALASRTDAERATIAADERVAHGLRRLLEEGLTTQQAAQLCDLTAGAAQKLLRRHAPTPATADEPRTHRVERDDRQRGQRDDRADAGASEGSRGGNG
jgi:hypothetical protein